MSYYRYSSNYGKGKYARSKYDYSSCAISLFLHLAPSELLEVMESDKALIPSAKMEVVIPSTEETTQFDSLIEIEINRATQEELGTFKCILGEAEKYNEHTEDYANLLNCINVDKEIRLYCGYKNGEENIYIKVFTGLMINVEEKYEMNKNVIILSGSDYLLRLHQLNGTSTSEFNDYASEVIGQLLDNAGLDYIIAIDDYWISDRQYVNQTLYQTLEEIGELMDEFHLYVDPDGYIIVAGKNYLSSPVYKILTEEELLTPFIHLSSTIDLINAIMINGIDYSASGLVENSSSKNKYGRKYAVLSNLAITNATQKTEIGNQRMSESEKYLDEFSLSLIGDPLLQPNMILHIIENSHSDIEESIKLENMTIRLAIAKYVMKLNGYSQ